MISLGIDPGPQDFAWALMKQEDIVQWGHRQLQNNPEGYCAFDEYHPLPLFYPTLITIEAISWAGGNDRPVDKNILITARQTGMIWMAMRTLYPDIPVQFITRQRVKAALPGVSVRDSDKIVNAAMQSLCPALKGRQKGLSSHTRAAAAVAYVGPGEMQRQKVEGM